MKWWPRMNVHVTLVRFDKSKVQFSKERSHNQFEGKQKREGLTTVMFHTVISTSKCQNCNHLITLSHKFILLVLS